MQTSERSEGLARARAKVRRGHARGAAEAAQSATKGASEDAAAPLARSPNGQPVDDPKDVAEAGGEPILDATGCAKWTGSAAPWKGPRMPLSQPVSMSSMTDRERRKGSGGDGPDASERWWRRAADN